MRNELNFPGSVMTNYARNYQSLHLQLLDNEEVPYVIYQVIQIFPSNLRQPNHYFQKIPRYYVRCVIFPLNNCIVDKRCYIRFNKPIEQKLQHDQLTMLCTRKSQGRDNTNHSSETCRKLNSSNITFHHCSSFHGRKRVPGKFTIYWPDMAISRMHRRLWC